VLCVRQQPANLKHTAQMINMALRTGTTQIASGEVPASFRDLIQMTPEEAESALQVKPSAPLQIMQMLGRIKYAACYPLAVVAFPYVRMRGYKGTYLYCLARLGD
jgi:hypothetical protein